MKNIKAWKSFEEQLAILRSRGLGAVSIADFGLEDKLKDYNVWHKKADPQS